ncbi:MAG: NAD-dependent epimerase/dehydratase family protein [Bacteriovoracaceae bacterium]|jgi:UDP-glucose 4-epimerase|nr:NAD-dependent epimerase/dehydratase family protein [Bacteriovoracaceae bacterium]
MTNKNKKILIIGIAGGLAKILTKLIWQNFPEYEVIGIDSRKIPKLDHIQNLQAIRMKYKRGNFENLFREHKFDYVFHLARISHSKSNKSNDLAKRLELSVMGTNRILDLCLKFNVNKVIILSTYHVYGALYDNSIFLKEDAPLKASMKYSQLRDVVEMDQICEGFMWKNKEKIETILLRPCNIIGNQVNNSMTKFLTGNLSLKPIDYNPIFQFIHEYDMAKVLMRTINDVPTGIYNVTPDDFISLNDAVDISSKSSLPFMMSAAGILNKVLKIANLNVPEYLIDYLKFSCLIDNSEIKKHLGENFYRFKVEESLKLIT